MKKHLLPGLLLVLSMQAALAQSSSPGGLALTASYFGEFVLHPGLTVGAEYALAQKGRWTLHTNADLGGYVHQYNHRALFAQASAGARYTTPSAFFADVNLGLGYLLSTPDGPVYQVTIEGTVEPGGRPYTSHLKPLTSLYLGWDATQSGALPFLIQAGLETYGQTHINQSILPHLALRVGIIYPLHHE